MQIEINGQNIAVAVRRSRRSRRLRLAVHPGGEVTITAPISMSDARLELFAKKFIVDKGKWLLKAINKLKKFAPSSQFPRKSASEIKKEYASLKAQAKNWVAIRLAHYNQFYGFKIGTISIRNQKSRWGSCSRRGNLNFNYRIALLPSHLADYIIVHELCHIGQLNHSKKFWDLVARTVPDYKKMRAELKSGFSLL